MKNVGFATDELSPEALLLGGQVEQGERSLSRTSPCIVANRRDRIEPSEHELSVTSSPTAGGAHRQETEEDVGPRRTDLCGRLSRGMGAVGSHVLDRARLQGRSAGLWERERKLQVRRDGRIRPPCFSPDRVFSLSIESDAVGKS